MQTDFLQARGLYFSPSSKGLVFSHRNRRYEELSRYCLEKIKSSQFTPEFWLGNGGVIVEGDTEKMMTLFCKIAAFWA